MTGALVSPRQIAGKNERSVSNPPSQDFQLIKGALPG
jgi:hypothetical protein